MNTSSVLKSDKLRFIKIISEYYYDNGLGVGPVSIKTRDKPVTYIVNIDSIKYILLDPDNENTVVIKLLESNTNRHLDNKIKMVKMVKK